MEVLSDHYREGGAYLAQLRLHCVYLGGQREMHDRRLLG